MNIFPSDFSHALTGFGGDPTMDRDEHRAFIQKTPVILIHANFANVADPQWGWLTMRNNLKKYGGYQDCEIWAMDYLGENNSQTDIPTPVKNHIDNVINFIDSVIAYLSVKRVDIICHSAGGMMTCAYMRSFKSDGTWDNSNHRLDKVGTAVFLACINHGLGSNAPGEFQTGGSFEVNSHQFDGIIDDTPRGVNDPNKMIAPVESWKVTTKLDVNILPPQNVYIAVIARGDFVDLQKKNTSRLVGADCNIVFDLGPSTIGHEKILKEKEVFDCFKDYLNKYSPVIPVSIRVSESTPKTLIEISESTPKTLIETGESYLKPLSVILNVTPTDTVVSYVAKCVTKEYQIGYIVDTVLGILNGNLTDRQTLTISTDGIWEVTFSSRGTSDIKRTYGVSVAKPTVKIEPDTPKFRYSLKVQAKASSGKLYYSFDGKHFNEGSTVRVIETKLSRINRAIFS